MQCRDIAEVLEQEGLSPLPDAARAHVARCSHCQDYIADLETIEQRATCARAASGNGERPSCSRTSAMSLHCIVLHSEPMPAGGPASSASLNCFLRPQVLALRDRTHTLQVRSL